MRYGPLTLIAAVVIVYANTVIIPYGLLDDYAFLAGLKAPDGKTGVFRQFLAAGRPLQGLAVSSVFALGRDVAGLGFVRLVGIVGTGLVALALMRTIQRHGFERGTALFFALLVTTLVPFQVYVSWTQYFIVPFAILAAYAAAGLAARALELPPDQASSRMLGVIGLLVIAAITYPIAAQYYVVFVAMALLTGDRPVSKTLLRGLCYGAPWVVALGVAFKVAKLGISWVPEIGNARAALVSNLPEKVAWFFRFPMSMSLDLFTINGYPSFPVAPALLFIGVGIIALPASSVWVRLTRVAIAAALVPASFASNLVVAENWATYRITGALSALLVFYLVLSARGWIGLVVKREPQAKSILRGVVALAAFVGCGKAFYATTAYVAIPQSTELRYIRSCLRSVDLSAIQTVYYKMPGPADSMVVALGTSEFGQASSTVPWATPNMIYLSWLELNRDRMPPPILEAPRDVPTPSGGLLIDMSLIQRFR